MKSYEITITVHDIDGIDGRRISMQLIRPVGDRREALLLTNPYVFDYEDVADNPEAIMDRWRMYKLQSIMGFMIHRSIGPFIAGMPYKHLLDGTIMAKESPDALEP